MDEMEEYEEINQGGLEEIRQVLGERIEYLRLVAQEAADRYWENRKRGNQANKYKSSLGCRIVTREAHFIMVWFQNSYSHVGPEVKTYSAHLKKGRTSKRYPDAVLKRAAQNWEIERVLKTEAVFSAIREELSAIASIRRQLKVHRRLAAKVDSLVYFQCFMECLEYTTEVGQSYLPVDDLLKVVKKLPID